MSHVFELSKRAVATFILLALALTALPARAQSTLSVTVTPPLIQLTIGPGETWRSSLKIVNTNDVDVTYYTQLMDMQASDEEGHSKFTPIIRVASSTEGDPSALAQWIEVPPEPLVIKAGSSGQLPFTVTIPKDASPGGHYAAILVGTQPGSVTGGTGIKVASYVSSLIFVNIKGDVVESGRVREFSTSEDLYQKHHADFLLRFENTGNTHLRPAGNIEIYNMWGKERGKVDFAQDANFGNVLPHSIRRYNFSWDGEESLFDIGRYSAIVTLAYGSDGKQNTSAIAYFWVVPIVPVSITLGSLLVFIILVTWLIRRYIRRALALERRRYGIEEVSATKAPVSAPHVPQQSVSTMQALMEPIREGVIDLRAVAKAPPPAQAPVATQEQIVQRLTFMQFLGKYRLFFLFIVVIVAGLIGAWRYFESTQKPHGSFQISDVKIQVEDAPAQ